jgi:endonuclease YncB( thermonuclease family)
MSTTREILDAEEKKGVEKFIVKYTGLAKVHSIYDGDTLKLIFPFNGWYYIWTCRIYGIDTPEIKTHNIEEKKKGLLARDCVIDISKKCPYFEINVIGFDKYGRVLTDIPSIKNILLEKGLAKEYDGGHKTPWLTFSGEKDFYDENEFIVP